MPSMVCAAEPRAIICCGVTSNGNGCLAVNTTDFEKNEWKADLNFSVIIFRAFE